MKDLFASSSSSWTPQNDSKSLLDFKVESTILGKGIF